MEKIQIKLSHGGKVERANKFDSGFDVFCQGFRKVLKENELSEEFWFDELFSKVVAIEPNETIMLLTGIQFNMPEPEEIYNKNNKLVGYKALEIQVRGRSGLSLKNNTNVKMGTGDNQFQGVYGIIFHNNSKNHIVIKKGMKVAQLIFNEVYIPTELGIEFVDKFKNKSDRGNKGFGSTGKE